MLIKVLGCGNAFSHRNYNQSFLLEENGKRMLIDCGTRVPLALKHFDIDIKSIDSIYISHAHADHIGGLEEIAFLSYDWKNHPRKWDDYKYNSSPKDYMYKDSIYKKYAPKLIANSTLLSEIWNQSLKGGLDSMEGFDSTLSTFFELVPVKPNVCFYWQGWKFDLIQQIHVMTGSVIKHTFGLLMSKKDRKTVYFTTDSQHCSPRQVEVFYDKADIIFQDCECSGVDMKKKEFIFSSGVHASYAQLAGYPTSNSIRLNEETKSKMWLSHYQDFVLDNKDFFGNVCNWDVDSINDGFQGFLKIGQIFDI